jgi:hypothetical protein
LGLSIQHTRPETVLDRPCAHMDASRGAERAHLQHQEQSARASVRTVRALIPRLREIGPERRRHGTYHLVSESRDCGAICSPISSGLLSNGNGGWMGEHGGVSRALLCPAMGSLGILGVDDRTEKNRRTCRHAPESDVGGQPLIAATSRSPVARPAACRMSNSIQTTRPAQGTRRVRRPAGPIHTH